MEKIKEMSIDLETYSDVDIKKSGVYKYADGNFICSSSCNSKKESLYSCIIKNS